MNGSEWQRMRVAALDIGTNTILLLIADVADGKIVKVLHDRHDIARLGEGVHATRMITPAAFQRALSSLTSYQKVIDSFHPDVVVAAGTSALRDALNRNEFSVFIADRLGFSIDVISGDEEALWTYGGALSGFLLPHESYAVIDIGGGSTEIIGGTARSISQKISLDIGAVRITELFNLDAEPSARGVEEASLFIRTELEKANTAALSHSFAIGVAGTVTTLAAIVLQLPAFDAARISGIELPRQSVDRIVKQFSSMTVDDIRKMPQVAAGRADVIFGGSLILSEFLHAGCFDSIAVSDRGLRYGLVLREAQRST